MADLNVVVTFFSRTGSTERLALAAALGAVNARARLRLRWLREEAAGPEIDSVPGWREERERMEREYIAPREIDVLWADALILAMPTPEDVSAPPVRAHLESLRTLHAAGKLHRKVATAFTHASSDASTCLESLCGALANLDLELVAPSPSLAKDVFEAARTHGRNVAERARALSVSTGK